MTSSRKKSSSNDALRNQFMNALAARTSSSYDIPSSTSGSYDMPSSTETSDHIGYTIQRPDVNYDLPIYPAHLQTLSPPTSGPLVPAPRQAPITIASTAVSVQPRRSNGAPHPTNGSNSCMAPTWTGFIHSTADAVVVLEACLQGRLSHIPRRPHDRERATIIVSGNVFIYEENASGIKRWTDGVTWSPSRIMGNFLVYRELNEPFPAGEKKKAKKRKRGASNEPSDNLNGQCEEDRKLVGSLVDSYGFKPGGLIKKTLNIKVNSVNHHIVSYYSLHDVKDGTYRRPSFDHRLDNLVIRRELMEHQFKAGFDVDELDPFHELGPQPVMPPSIPTSMPRQHGGPLNHSTYAPTHVHQPVSSIGHPLPQAPLTSAPLQYHSVYQPQNALTYPWPSQSSLNFQRDSLDASVTVPNQFYVALPATGNQGPVLDTNLNTTGLDTGNPYMYQNTTQGNMYSSLGQSPIMNSSPKGSMYSVSQSSTMNSSPIHHQWSNELADELESPPPKRRQTNISSMPIHNYSSSVLIGGFDPSHGLPFFQEPPSASPVF